MDFCGGNLHKCHDFKLCSNHECSTNVHAVCAGAASTSVVCGLSGTSGKERGVFMCRVLCGYEVLSPLCHLSICTPQVLTIVDPETSSTTTLNPELDRVLGTKIP